MSQPNPQTMAKLISDWADKEPDRDVLTFESGGIAADEMRTYSELWANANRLAAGLAAEGMVRGDRFAILVRNHPEFVELMVAAAIVGCVFVPIDPRTKGAKLAYTLNNSECSGVVCADYSLAELDQVRGEVPSLRWLWVLESREKPTLPSARDVAAAKPLQEILQAPQQWPDWRGTSEDDPFQIIYTSGTTGDPKGVVATNRRYGRGGPAVDFFGVLTYEQRPYTGLSLTHGNAQGLTLMPALALGQRAVFSRRFTKTRLWDVTRRYGCTSFNLLGGMATAIYSEPERPDDGDNPVQFVISSGMPAAIWENFERRFNVKVLEMYGAMEGGNAFKPIGQGPVGSFGKPSPSLEMKIVDEDGNECPPDVPGELICRPVTGEPATVSYWNNPEASAKKVEGGWLRSGDIAHRDADGWLFFHHRKGDGIRRNGDFINPGFVESVLAECPHVDDAFVYGIPSSNGAPGEKDVVAAIVAADRERFDPANVFAVCESKLEANFVPSYLQLLDEIPKTASEKPQARFMIQALAQADAKIFAYRDRGATRVAPDELRVLAG